MTIMQTFLPYPDFKKSALCLDKKRCWKQVVETSQIINILEGKSAAWSNHPAVQMWKGSPTALKKYFNAFLEVSIVKHTINTKYEFFDIPDKAADDTPWWMGNDNFHRAMRSRLIAKDEAFYLPLFPKDKEFNDSKYFWPIMDGSKTFKII